MNPVVILLIVIGIAFILISFIFLESGSAASGKKEEVTLHDYELDEKQMENLQNNIKEVVSAYADKLVDDTEKRLNDVSSQKMMQINELTEQALGDLKKSHDQVVFLQDMLSDKENSLKQYVSNSAQKLFTMQQNVMKVTPEDRQDQVREILEPDPENQVAEHLKDEVKKSSDPAPVEEDMEGTGETEKRKDEIISLYKSGVPQVEIARRLDIGIGEVQLVCGLYQGDKS